MHYEAKAIQSVPALMVRTQIKCQWFSGGIASQESQVSTAIDNNHATNTILVKCALLRIKMPSLRKLSMDPLEVNGKRVITATAHIY
jgi:hypothetical protein